MKRAGIWAVVCLCLAGAVALLGLRHYQRSQTRTASSSALPDSGENGGQSAQAGAGGVVTPGQPGAESQGAAGTATGNQAGAAKDAATKANQAGKDEKKVDPRFDYGKTTPVKGNANPQVRSIAEALRDKNHPERLSPLLPPKAFDAAAYKQDPKAYLDVVEPGRCFQSAQPGKDVPKLQPLSPQLQEVAQGQSVTLRVRATPKSPISFTSFDLGKFQNELTAITVEANDQGVAEVKFWGTAGTINEVNIVAASPMSSGQARFIVNVTKQ